MNPEYLQALWTFGVTIACYVSVISELLSPKVDSLPPEEQDAGIVVYDEFARLNPDCANAYLLRGSALLNKQEYKKALDDFEQAIRLAPESAEAYLGRAQAHQNCNEVDASLVDFNEAIRLKPDYSMAYVGRGQILLLKAEQTPATLDISPGSVELPCDAERPANLRSTSSTEDLYNQSLADFEEAIRLDPLNSHAFSFRGFYRHRQGRFKEALEDFDEAIQLDPKLSMNYQFRARLLSSMHKMMDALDDYDQAIELNPNASQVLFERAFLLMNHGQREEALEDAHRAISLDPSNTAFHDLRAVLRFQSGDFDAAITDFNEILKLDPHDVDTRWKRSIARVRNRDFAKGLLDALVVDDRNPKLLSENLLEDVAIQVLRTADEVLAELTDQNQDEPQFAASFRDRGLACFVLGFSDKALSALNAAIRLDQSSSLAYVLRGRIRLGEREWNLAIEDFNAAIELNPSDASFYIDRGRAHSEKAAADGLPEPTVRATQKARLAVSWSSSSREEWKSACSDFNTAIELDSHQFRAYAHRGVARQALGELDLAIADYDHVISAGPFYKRSERNWMTQSGTTQPNTDANQSSIAEGDGARTITDVITSAATSADDPVFLNTNEAVTSSAADFLGSAIKPANPVRGMSASSGNQPGTNTNALMDITNPFQPHYQLRIDPDCVMAYRHRAACHEIRREWSKAIADHEMLTHLLPKDSIAHCRIAWLKATCPDDSCRNGAEALESALRSIELAHANDIDCLIAIAAAYAEIDDFENAIEYQSRAHEAAIAVCQKEFDERRQHFQSVALDKFLDSDDKAPATTNSTIIDTAVHQCEQTHWMDANLIEDLADAYANADQLQRAIDCQQKAHNLKRTAREEPLLEVLELYQSRRPYRAFGEKVDRRK